jgi:hypothetical protein
MSEQNYCYQCCLADICKRIDRGTHTLASPACDAFDPGMRWIPVTERLPEEWTEVLVFARCRPDADGFVQTAVYIGNPGCWRVTWNNCMLEYNIVTHWRPLPEEPKEDADA